MLYQILILTGNRRHEVRQPALVEGLIAHGPAVPERCPVPREGRLHVPHHEGVVLLLVVGVAQDVLSGVVLIIKKWDFGLVKKWKETGIYFSNIKLCRYDLILFSGVVLIIIHYFLLVLC